jgi:hypothetical protein
MATFTADALIAELIFYDSFDRTVEVGLGGRYLNESGAGEVIASVSGVAAVIDGTADAPSYWSPSGFPRPHTGIFQFNFYVPEDPVDGWFYYAVESRAGDDPIGLEIYLWDEDTAEWAADFYPSAIDPYVWVPTPGTFYTIKGYVTSTSGGFVGLKVWALGDPEPDTWGETGTNSGAFGWFGSYLYLDAGRDTDQSTAFDEFYVWRTSSDPFEYQDYFTADAVFLKTNFHADAVIAPRNFPGDAVVLRTQSFTGTPADEPFVGGGNWNSSWTAVSSLNIQKPAGIEEVESGDFMVVVVRTAATTTITFSGWSLRATITHTDGSLTRTYYKVAGGSEPNSYPMSFSPSVGVTIATVFARGVDTILEYDDDTESGTGGDAIITTPSATIPSRVVVLGVFISRVFGPDTPIIDPPLAYEIDAPEFFHQISIGWEFRDDIYGVAGPYTATANEAFGLKTGIIMLLGKTGTGILASAVILSPNFTANARIFRPTTVAFTANAFIAEPVRNRHHLGDDPHLGYELATDVYLDDAIGPFPPITTSLQEYLAWLNGEITKLESFITTIVPFDAILLRNQTASRTLDAILRAARASSFAGDAVIDLDAVEASFFADAITKATLAFSFTANAVSLRTMTGSFTADAMARTINAFSFSADAVTLRTITGSFTCDAEIFTGSVSGSFTADAIIEVIRSDDFTADAEIASGLVDIKARVADSFVEILVAETAASPTDITGAGVTQALVEAIVIDDAAEAKVDQSLTEILVSDDDAEVFVTDEFVEVLVAETAASPTTITGAGVTQQLIEAMVTDDTAEVQVTDEYIEIIVKE